MIGTMLGNRYELLEKIGEGGMALVYKAKCHLLNRYVAVKILKDQYSNDKEFVEKFKREATAVASLSDNNIVNIYDVGTQGDINYIVMEYINGKTLKQIIREQGKIPTSKTASLAIQIARALDCAHRNNIIHRDIKPQNILVTNEGLVKVTDFGIAKASNSVTITNSSKVMGSAHYFSPEQARGSFVDCRTDIYSLGIVIYEMCTGRVPYDADSPVSVALKHIQEPVVPPKQLNENIPDSLNKLILKAVEKEPIKRYQTIKDMLTDLRKIENNQEFNISTSDFDEDMTRVMDAVVVDDKDKYDKNKYGDRKKYDDEYEDDSEKRRVRLDPKKRKILTFITAAILVLVIGGISGYFALSKGSAKETTVPKIVDMKQEDAKKAVEDKKLKFVVIGKEKSDKPEGTVLRTYPEAGTNVKINSEVRVSISNGPDKLAVPSLINMDLDSAKDVIEKSGLKLGNVTRKYSDSVPEGNIISQDPQPDSDATADTKINLVVSRGQEVKNITVPDVNGKSIDEASGIISSAGFNVSRSAVDTSDKSQDGKVISQSVSGGDTARAGKTINLTYYKYKEQPVTDPSKQPTDPLKQPTDQPSGNVDTGGSQGKGNGGNSNNKSDSGKNSNNKSQ
ncbi:Stk1 family PASTA domain-containing Ser/Thr kinase [Clostridium sp. P21]|uniref:non-specific serine/threonine protein kinase n=1 Tax=Clostridium muellerianum TaxID=2716538 RepID=A0A7Y0ELF2_9CLOT|nr:Stk1 family PASTA domain-containing Ser/Thr kinase [Clostridium muellerianum]NMM65638.1 Stk1 family PASTA domain-containing Ser/Thr kinase [Clostridium muellerianum]